MASDIPLALSFIGAGLSAAVAESFTFPMDQLKTKMQLGGTQGSTKYSGPIHAIKDGFATTGIKGFYWGVVPAVNRQLVYSGVRFSLYDYIKSELGMDNSAGFIQKFLIGGFTGGLGSFICTPLDVCKIRIINDPHKAKYSGFVDCMVKTSKEGIRNGFFRGSSPNTYRAIVVTAIELGVYDNAKNALIALYGFDENSIMLRFWASLAAGFFASVGSSPIDVVKTRYMNTKTADPNAVKGTEMRFSSPFDCFKKILASEGIMGFYNGFWFLWLRLGPWCTIMFLCFEAYKDVVGKEYKKYKTKDMIKE